MGSEINIRIARPEDAEPIAGLTRDVIEDGLPPTWSTQRVTAAICDRDTEAIVARIAGHNAGFALMALGEEDAHLLLIGVDRRFHRMGIGRTMLRWLETLARTAFMRAIRLEVRANKPGARAFYHALGYHDISLRPAYYSGLEDAVVMIHFLAIANQPAEPGP